MSTAPNVWLDYDQAGLDRAYDQRAWCADAPAWLARYKAETKAARAALRSEVLSYGPHLLDLYRARAPRRGVHLHIHGGAWRAQSRDDAGFVAPALTAAGFDVAVPDFSHLPAKRLPEVVEELRHCVALLSAQGPIHVSGHSSGAHLAAVLATELPLASVTLVSGAYDLEPVLLSSRRDYVHLSTGEAEALSPLRHAGRIAAPVLLAWGDAESPEFIRQGEAMAAAVNGRCFVLHGMHHFSAPYALASGPLHDALIAQS
ncbi:MAG TPA: alpha/beta hydrolase fold domain-containing protein [Falsiroseomonas sp.]|nr:alpha/beta hydrolase fold domain-containing protein [Falsiroseomonas sp.]